MRAVLCCALVGLLATAAVFANPVVWPPDNRMSPLRNNVAVPLSIRANPGTQQTTVILPRGLLNQLRAEAPPADQGSRFAVLPPQHTIIAGVALSAALVLGGLWLARGGKRRALLGFTCLLAVVVVVGLSCGPNNKEVREDHVVYDDWRPPTLQDDGTLSGRCKLDRGEGDEVMVVIDREALTKLAQQTPKPDAPKQ